MEILGKQDIIVDGRVPPEHLVDTTLCEQIPYIKSIVEDLFTWDMCDRVMISKVDNKQRINWHSHNYYETVYTHAYVHIPLITSPHAQMLVYMDNKIHIENYPKCIYRGDGRIEQSAFLRNEIRVEDGHPILVG